MVWKISDDHYNWGSFFSWIINYVYRRQSKMSQSKKKLQVKGLCGRCLSEFIDWSYSQSCWYFWPLLLNCCPSNLLSGSTLPPPSMCEWVFCIHLYCTVFKGGGGRYGILGLIQINTCRKVPLQINFLDNDIILHCLLWVLVSTGTSYFSLKIFSCNPVKYWPKAEKG